MKFSYNDKVHGYWYGGERCKNVTGVAKFTEDTERLQEWNTQKVAIGFAIQPELLEVVRLNVDNSKKISEMCETAASIAGAREGRDHGVVVHHALESFDLGKKMILSDLTSTVIGDWKSILAAKQWTVVYTERCVVWPKAKIAGRFDRIVSGAPCPGCGRSLYILDFKTGANILKYPKAIASQLALYVHAELLVGEFEVIDDKGWTEEFEPMPECCTCWGYVVHMPIDAEPQLIRINIAEGHRAVTEIIFPIIEWRKLPNENIAEVVDLPGVSHERSDAMGSDPFDVAADSAPSLGTPPVDDDPFAGLPNETNAPVLNKAPAPLIDLTNRQWNIADRLTFLKKNHTEMAQIVAGRWPEGVPNIKMPLTNDDLDRIEAVLIDAERAVEAPFDPPPVQIATDEDVRVGLQAALDELGMTWDELAYQHAKGTFDTDLARRTWLAYSPLSVPGEQPHGTPTPLTEEPSAPGQRIYAYDDGQQWDGQPRDIDEGPDMAPADIAAFKATFADLDAEQQVRIDAWAAQAHAAGVSISMRDKPSKRRFSIGRFLLIASHHHEDVVRAVLSLALGDEIQTVITTGSVLGVLTQAEAEKAWEILLGVDGGAWTYDLLTRRLVAA